MGECYFALFHSTYRVVAWGCGRLVAAPTGCSIFIVWLNVLFYPASFNVQGGSVRFRDDVGIVPYIPSGLHTIQRGASKPSGFGRLVAAPTVTYHSTGRVKTIRWRAAGSRPYGVRWDAFHSTGRVETVRGRWDACHFPGRVQTLRFLPQERYRAGLDEFSAQDIQEALKEI